jgi:hypothetical protein
MNKDTNTLDKKLQMYIAAMAISRMPFGREWDSSAKKLQEDLQKRGIKLPLFYEYKMPFGNNQIGFMDKMIIDYFCSHFFQDYATQVLKDKKLKIGEKAKIFKYVWQNRGKYNDILKQYEMEIRKLNPELANVQVDNSRSLVYGAMFGFAPAEIAYFSDTSQRNHIKEKAVQDILKNQFGINLTYVLAPKTAEMVINALNQNINSKER